MHVDDGVAYLLQDLFATALSAGAVNGTSSEPIGGIRTVLDTNSKLSIAGGALTIATGGVGSGNPGVWYPSIARASGIVLLGQMNFMAFGGADKTGIGWSILQSTTTLDFGVWIRDIATLRITANNAQLNVDAGPLSTGVTYSVAVILRATGAYYFIKGGVYTNWTLIWVSSAFNTSPLFPQITGGTSTSTFDNLRVPVSLYAVPILAYDTFTRANGALGSSEVAGPDGQTVIARPWTVQAGTIAIVSNAASLTLVGGGLNAIATLDGVSSDALVEASVTRTLGSGGIVLRYVDANNYLRATHDGTNALLEQVVAGTPTTLRTGIATYAAGALLRVVISGVTGILFYNGAAVGASFTVPSSTSTLHGIYGSDLSCLWDNLLVMPRGVGNEYGGLDGL